MGRSIASGGDPKGSGRERREAGIQWIQPPKAVSDPEFRQTTSGTHGSAGCADCLPRGKPPTRPLAHTPVLCGYADSPKGVQGGERKAPLLAALGNNFAVSNSPLAGPDAPTPARIGTCRPMGRSHFSFGGERKVCKRKPAARRLREKALYCPFLKEGVRNVARSTVELPTWTFVRARAHSFPLSKRAGLFPSAAYRRSASPPLGWGQRSDSAGWEVSAGLGGSCGTNIQRGDLSIPSTYL